MEKNTKFLILGAFAIVFIFYKKGNTATNGQATTKAKTYAKNNPGIVGLKSLSLKFGFVPVSALVTHSKDITTLERKAVATFLKKVEQDYDKKKAQTVEKIIISETSRFSSLLFKSTRNVGGILGTDIYLYIKNNGSQNLIMNTKEGKKWGYRVYDNITDACNDLLNVIKKHDFDAVKYSGNTVPQSYWDGIKTKIIV